MSAILENHVNSYPSKRLLDILVSGTACITFAPLAVGISLAAWLEDGKPPFFRQSRIGAHRRPFTILKFRSMHAGQVTRVGSWLRETGVDELPQFVNVLRGDMSVVGPRPLTEYDVERLGWRTPEYDWRFTAKPGITGLSQLLAGRGARFSERVDRLYLQRQSLARDLRLIALSFAVNLAGKRQVRRWLRSVARLSSSGSRAARSPS
jgi:lipopolysaccharide/colanic/teichoic acid biosynthesis glycosyltransferase